MTTRTGPAAQINLMGYANPAQTAHGILMRLRSRAFLISQFPEDLEGIENDSIAMEQQRQPEVEEVEEQERALLRWNWKKHKQNLVKENTLANMADPERTVCFVSIDAGMGSDLLNMRVLKRLEELLPDQGGKKLCHLENLSIR
jgi:Neutral/alkaline non-lysosomal ceramidase, N-terminal